MLASILAADSGRELDTAIPMKGIAAGQEGPRLGADVRLRGRPSLLDRWLCFTLNELNFCKKVAHLDIVGK